MQYDLHLPESYDLSQSDAIAQHWRDSGKDPVIEIAKILLGEVKKQQLGYLRFGAYWWALKSIFIKLDLVGDIGDSDFLIEGIYKGRLDLETLIMADQFSTWYDQNQFQGARETEVNLGGDSYQLYDSGFDPFFQG